MTSTYERIFKIELGKLLVDEALKTVNRHEAKQELLTFKQQLDDMDKEVRRLEALEFAHILRSVAEEIEESL